MSSAASHPSSPAAQRPALPAVLAAVAIALLLGLQPVATDLYLPGLPGMTRELSGRLSDGQATMSVLILAFGFGQLLWGPVSDRFGRRPVLLTGLSLFVLGAGYAAIAQDMQAVIAMRALQGLGMAASIVCARALVRDLYEPHEGMRVLALGMSGMAAVAIVCPIVGGWSSTALGWRGSMAIVAGIGLVLLVFVAWRLPETVPQRNPTALQPRVLISTWWRILQHPRFRAYAGLATATYAGLFVYLSSSSFICLGILHLSNVQYGLVLVSTSLVYLSGTTVCRRWLASVGAAKAVRRGAMFSLVGGLSMAALALAGVQTLWAVLLPQWLFCFGHGIHQPCGQAGAVSPFPREAGSASALAGFLMSAVAFGVGSWLGAAMDGSTRALGIGMGISGAVVAAIAWTAVRRHGAVSNTPPTTPVAPAAPGGAVAD